MLYIPHDTYICNVLARFRTAINVLGDSIGAGIVDHLSKGELDQLDGLEGGAAAPGQGEDEKIPLTEKLQE